MRRFPGRSADRASWEFWLAVFHAETPILEAMEVVILGLEATVEVTLTLDCIGVPVVTLERI